MTNLSHSKTPVIVCDSSTWQSASILNPNEWSNPNSRAIIHSALAELSMLVFCIKNIEDLCNKREQLCSKKILDIKKQYQSSPFNLDQTEIFFETPILHALIEAAFSGIKTTLDIIMELLSTEEVVSSHVRGFHEKGKKVINQLKNNCKANKADLSKEIIALIEHHKNDWMTNAIEYRNLFIHPSKNFIKIMFRGKFQEVDNGTNIECKKILIPKFKGQEIYDYLSMLNQKLTEFLKSFLTMLKNASV